MGLLGLSLVFVVVFCGLFADWIGPYDPFKINVPDRTMPPSLVHLLGTDKVGRDVFSRVLKGSQIALFVGVTSIVISQLIGLTLGLIAGYAPRWLDNFLLLIFDSIYSFPTVMLGLTVMTLLGALVLYIVVHLAG